MSNLEPIEDSDLNLKEKFVGGERAEAPKAPNVPVEKKAESIILEAVPQPEKLTDQKIELSERKEYAAEKEEAYSKISQKIPAAGSLVSDDQSVQKDAKETSLQEIEKKIDYLVKLAELKGIPHAVKVARHLDDNYVLDEFHDKLITEELHQALLERGIIKEI